MECIIPGPALASLVCDPEAAVVAAVVAAGVDIDLIAEAASAKGDGGVFVAVKLTDGRTRTRRISADGRITGNHGNVPASLQEWLDR